jgi:hypothetical protein
MSNTLKDRITQTLDQVSARARELAKSIGLRSNPPRKVPIPVPVRPRR